MISSFKLHTILQCLKGSITSVFFSLGHSLNAFSDLVQVDHWSSCNDMVLQVSFYLYSRIIKLSISNGFLYCPVCMPAVVLKLNTHLRNCMFNCSECVSDAVLQIDTHAMLQFHIKLFLQCTSGKSDEWGKLIMALFHWMISTPRLDNWS